MLKLYVSKMAYTCLAQCVAVNLVVYCIQADYAPQFIDRQCISDFCNLSVAQTSKIRNKNGRFLTVLANIIAGFYTRSCKQWLVLWIWCPRFRLLLSFTPGHSCELLSLVSLLPTSLSLSSLKSKPSEKMITMDSVSLESECDVRSVLSASRW